MTDFSYLYYYWMTDVIAAADVFVAYTSKDLELIPVFANILSVLRMVCPTHVHVGYFFFFHHPFLNGICHCDQHIWSFVFHYSFIYLIFE